MTSRSFRSPRQAARAGGAVAARLLSQRRGGVHEGIAAGQGIQLQPRLGGRPRSRARHRRRDPRNVSRSRRAGRGAARRRAACQDVLSSEHLWIVDPIDGTSNFVHGIPHFGVSVAYYHQGQPACGVMGNPIRDEWFIAAAGQGAFHNGQRARVARESAAGRGPDRLRLLLRSRRDDGGDAGRRPRSPAQEHPRRAAHGRRDPRPGLRRRWATSAPSSSTSLLPGISPPAASSLRRPAARSPPAGASRYHFQNQRPGQQRTASRGRSRDRQGASSAGTSVS